MIILNVSNNAIIAGNTSLVKIRLTINASNIFRILHLPPTFKEYQP